jgi:hypothetical protein
MKGHGLFGGRCLVALTLTTAALSGRQTRVGAAEAAGTSVPPAPTAPAAPTDASYESLAHGAVKTQDVATLLAPFVDTCGGEMRDLDRARCRATNGYLHRELPHQTFSTQSDPAAIQVSSYDAAIKGYHVALAGCLACTDPLPIGDRGEPRYVTLEIPDKTAATLAAGVPLSKSNFAFDDLPAAKRWVETERPFLRAEFLYQPQAEGAAFTIGMAPGIALKLVGARIYNRCTGEILVSKPPSTGYADRPAPGHQDPACARAGKAAEPDPNLAAEDTRAEQLSKAVIGDAMTKISPRLFECYQKFHVPGALVLSYVVGGNGTVQSVQVGTTFAGTPTGTCSLEVAKEARFPSFKRDRQEFKYLFYLRRQ